MYTLGNILIGFLAAIIGLLGLLSFAMAGLVMGMVSLSADFAALVSFLPFLLMGICGLGIWALFAGSHAGKLAFTLIMLMFWYIGTALGAVILLCLLCGDRPQKALPQAEALPE